MRRANKIRCVCTPKDYLLIEDWIEDGDDGPELCLTTYRESPSTNFEFLLSPETLNDLIEVLIQRKAERTATA